MKPQIIELRVAGGLTIDVEATVIGAWAVHRSHVARRTWMISHVPSGRALTFPNAGGTRTQKASLVKLQRMLSAIPDLFDAEDPVAIHQHYDAIQRIVRGKKGLGLHSAPTRRDGWYASISYQTISNMDEDGNYDEEHGWEVEEERYDSLSELLRVLGHGRSWLEWSSSPPYGMHDWVVGQADEDFRTGASTTESLHIKWWKGGRQVRLTARAMQKITNDLQIMGYRPWRGPRGR